MANKIAECLAEFNSISQDIVLDCKQDLANIWKNKKNLEKLDNLLKFFEQSDPEGFNDFFAKRSKALRGIFQEECIHLLKVFTWFKYFKIFIEDVRKFVFFRSIYYNYYDIFSEKSRNNNAKAALLSSLLQENKHALEIGPGTGPLFSRLIANGHDVSCIELDKSMLSILKNRCPSSLQKMKEGNFFHYNFGMEKFDLHRKRFFPCDQIKKK